MNRIITKGLLKASFQRGIQNASRKAPYNYRYSLRQLPTSFSACYSTSPGEDKGESKGSSEESTATSTPTEEAPKEEPAAASAEQEIAKLQKDLKDMKEKLLRSYAEEENVRRIAKRDVDNAKAYANSSFAKSMLDVADDLERALAVVPSDKKPIQDPLLKALVDGIEMTDKNLMKIFKQFGIVQFGKVDDVFDPNMHDAMFQMPCGDKPEGTIGQVMKTGYKLNDRIIRAAQVGTRVN